MRRVLITGGAGYLGSVLSEVFLEAGWAVTVLDNLSHGEQSLFHLCARPAYEFVQGDARDEGRMRELLREAEVIVPLAAVVGAPACARDPSLARSVNLEAIRLLNRLRSREQLVVFPTTNSGYGTKSGATFCTEETPLEPISLYGQTKAEAESELLGSENALSLRLATVFGLSPRMRLDLLVNHFVYAAVTDGYLVIFEKDFKRNFIHIRDVADCFVHCIQNAPAMAGQVYNVGLDSANLSKAELAQRIQKEVPGFHVHYAEVGTDPDKRNYQVSNERLRRAGFEARRSVETGIKELLRGYGTLGRARFKNV